MFCYSESLLAAFSAVLVMVLVLSRSALLSGLVTGGLYVGLRLFSLEPVAPSRAQLIVQPHGNPARIAHRGGGHDAPENTLAAIRQKDIRSIPIFKSQGFLRVYYTPRNQKSAFKILAFNRMRSLSSSGIIRILLKARSLKAAENGATGVELDVEFTADGIPILMHDTTIDRTTDGSGSLRDLTFAEIKQFNPAAKHRLWRDYRGEKIPTLKEAVLESMHHNLIIYFDVKGHADQAVAALKLLYLEYPRLYNTSIVCSFNPEVVYKMRKADRNVVTALTHRPWSISHLGDGTPRFESVWKHYWSMFQDVIMDWSMHNFLWRLCGVSAFLVQKNFVSQVYVNQWSSKGVQVVPWTVNTIAEKMYYENFLQTSYITDSLLEDCDPHY